MTRIYLTTPLATVTIGPYDSHVWDWCAHLATAFRDATILRQIEEILSAPLTTAEIEAQRFCDRLAAVGIDNAHNLMQR